MLKKLGVISLLILILSSVTYFLLFMFNLKYNGTSSLIKLYYADNISQAHRDLIERFNGEYAGKIEVIPVNLPFSKFNTNERKEILARMLRTKSDRIDIFAVDIIWTSRFARWSLPLTDFFLSDELDHILPFALTSCYQGKELYAIPLYIDISMMYYRRDLIEKLPNSKIWQKKLKESITWNDFLLLYTVLSKLPDYQNYPFYTYQADNYEGLMCSFWETVGLHQQEIFKGDTLDLAVPAVHQGAQLLVDLVQRYHISPVEVTSFDEIQGYRFALLKHGVFFRGWPGLFQQHKQLVQDSSVFENLEPAALPHFEGSTPTYVFGGWNLMVSRYSTNKKSALLFLKFLIRKENQLVLYPQGGYIPISKEIVNDQVLMEKYPDLKYYYELLGKGIHRPSLVNYTQISDVISYYLKEAIMGHLSVPEAMHEAEQMINSRGILFK